MALIAKCFSLFLFRYLVLSLYYCFYSVKITVGVMIALALIIGLIFGLKNTCSEGYGGQLILSCDNVNECDLGIHDCHLNATCEDTLISWRCLCHKGYIGNGRSCIDVDECEKGRVLVHFSALLLHNFFC